jgi:hypothetical protein
VSRDCSNFEQAALRTRTHLRGRGETRRNNTIRRHIMKKLILGAALAVLVASPALAQPRHHADYNRLDGIRAQAPAVNSGAVYVDGNYAGTDPDPNVRLQLQKDYPSVLDR